MENYENLTLEEWCEGRELSINIFNNKYKYGNETFMETINRISGGNEEVKKLILEKKFLPGGRICANRGLDHKGRKVTMSNCYVMNPIEDNIESIFDTAKELARTFSYGGGCGIDVSKLAPNGALVNNAAKCSSGAVSFMDLYSQVTGLISQNGRRGALMISMDVNHPDIKEFIHCKSDLTKVTKANISVRIDDKFMNAVINDESYKVSFERPETKEVIEVDLSAREVFKEIAHEAWDMAEPGVLFWDTIEKVNYLDSYPDFKYAGTNPCVTGDTNLLIKTPHDDIEIPIKDIVGESVEIWNGYEWSTVVPMITGYDQHILRIVVGNNQSDYIREIKCTDYHKFIMEDGNRKEAKDLQVGDILSSFEIPNDTTKKLQILSIEDAGIADTVYCVNEPKNHSVVFNGIMTGNCGELPLPAYGACLLGSLNLSAFVDQPFTENANFNFGSLKYAASIAIKELDVILNEGIPQHPLKQQQETARKWRPIGLGVMGIADMFIMLGIEYGSKESVELAEEIARVLAVEALCSSILLAKDRGAFPHYEYNKTRNSFMYRRILDSLKPEEREAKKILMTELSNYGIRNSQLLTIAPTGTLSNLLGISGGIEPIFANSYMRKTESLHNEDVYYKVYTPIVEKYMKAHNLKDESELPEYFITSQEIDFHDRIDVQAAFQTYIDNSISSTINLPEETTVEQVEELYQYAWTKKLKGVTIFRDNCRRIGVLTVDKKNEETDIDKELSPDAIDTSLKRGEIKGVSDDCIGYKRKLMTGCGSLHCIAMFDKDTGELLETYLSKGSTGGCNNFMVGLSRMISLAARGGISVEAIVDQLKSTGACPSYATRRATKGDTSLGACCPMAVGNAIMDMYNEHNRNYRRSEEKVEDVETSNADQPKIELSEDMKCPTCGDKLDHEGGCDICRSCGWTKCN